MSLHVKLHANTRTPSHTIAQLITATATACPPPPHPPSRPPRFYIPHPLQPSIHPPGFSFILPSEEAYHATKSLRMKQGDVLELCDGVGGIALAALGPFPINTNTNTNTSKECYVHLLEPPIIAPRDSWEWTLAVACGSLKGGRGDWLVEKATELGASRLIPLLTARSPTIGSSRGSGNEWKARSKSKKRGGDDGDDDDSLSSSIKTGREGRWQRVAAAAMKQCLRPRAMEIEAPTTMVQLCSRCAAEVTNASDARTGGGGSRHVYDVRLVGTEGAPPVSSRSGVLHLLPQQQEQQEQQQYSVLSPRQGILIIGPEGDFSGDEVELLAAAGVVSVGLGALRLRTETAAIALLSYARMVTL